MKYDDDTSLDTLVCPYCDSTFGILGSDHTEEWALKNSNNVGGFRLVQRLGAGGFGTVFKAHDPQLDRFVALKVPRFTTGDPDEQNRFLREARAAAQLKHENIVCVHEVGVHDGLLFIVSDFIDGITLKDWIQLKSPSIRKAVDLCVQLSSALAHAHKNGVIHRDLKPSNVMIDGNDVPHLMDFGLARRNTGEASVTLDGTVIGTPAYMSPEQAFGEGHTATEQSDIYSLGVLLFELLSGELPFRGETRTLLYQVKHSDPPSLTSLNDRIPLDLNTITLRCLEKKPERRFESAQALSDELQRWKHGRPILSRPIGRLERSWRWCDRNRLVASLFAAVFLSLVVGTVASSWFAIQANREAKAAETQAEFAAMKAEEAERERNLADKERERSEARLLEAMDAIDNMLIRVADQTLQAIPRVERVRRDLLVDATKLYDSMLADESKDPRVITANANAHLRLGMMQQLLGEYTDAEREMDLAIRLVSGLDDSLQTAALHAECVRFKSMLRSRENDIDQGLALAKEAISLVDSHPVLDELEVDSAELDSEFRLTLGRCYATIGSLSRRLHPEDSVPSYEKAIRIFRSLVRDFPDDRDLRISLVRAHKNISGVHSELGQTELAERAARESITLALQVSDQEDPVLLNDLARGYNRLGNILRNTNRFEDAEKWFRKSLEIRKTLVADFPMMPDYHSGLARTYSNLGNLRQLTDQSEDAEKFHRMALELRDSYSQKFTRDEFELHEVARSHRSLGSIYRESERFEEAEHHMKRAVECWAQAASQSVSEPLYVFNVTQGRRVYAQLLQRMNKMDEAGEEFETSVRLSQELVEQYPRVPSYFLNLSQSHRAYASFLRKVDRINDANQHRELGEHARATYGSLLKEIASE